MRSSDIQTVRGVSIATFIMAIIGIVFWVPVIALAVLACVMAFDPGFVSWADGYASYGEPTYGYLLGSYGWLAFVFVGLLAVGLALAIITLIAAYKGMKTTEDVSRYDNAFIWAIVGAVASFFGGNLICTALMGIAAGFLSRLRHQQE